MSAAKFWPRESRNRPLIIELSMEVNCLRDSLTISIRPPPPRNKSAEVNCVALINSRRSRRIVTISFSPEKGFGLMQAVSHLEQRSTATVKDVFRFYLTAFS